MDLFSVCILKPAFANCWTLSFKCVYVGVFFSLPKMIQDLCITRKVFTEDAKNCMIVFWCSTCSNLVLVAVPLNSAPSYMSLVGVGDISYFRKWQVPPVFMCHCVQFMCRCVLILVQLTGGTLSHKEGKMLKGPWPRHSVGFISWCFPQGPGPDIHQPVIPSWLWPQHSDGIVS